MVDVPGFAAPRIGRAATDGRDGRPWRMDMMDGVDDAAPSGRPASIHARTGFPHRLPAPASGGGSMSPGLESVAGLACRRDPPAVMHA